MNCSSAGVGTGMGGQTGYIIGYLVSNIFLDTEISKDIEIFLFATDIFRHGEYF